MPMAGRRACAGGGDDRQATCHKLQITTQLSHSSTNHRAGAGSGSGSGILRDIHTYTYFSQSAEKEQPPRRLLCGSLPPPACLPAQKRPEYQAWTFCLCVGDHLPACARVGSSQSLGAAVAHVCTEQKGVQDGEDRRYSGCTGRTTTGGPSRAHWAGTNKPQCALNQSWPMYGSLNPSYVSAYVPGLHMCPWGLMIRPLHLLHSPPPLPSNPSGYRHIRTVPGTMCRTSRGVLALRWRLSSNVDKKQE